jgi:peptidoglycan/LPS O-acetylase OafA/YrhL
LAGVAAWGSVAPNRGSAVIEFKKFQTTKYFSCLDGLRAIAIIAVVWHHTATSEHVTILSRGFLGVDLFFVISGFLIVTLLLRERSKTGTVSLRGFYLRRCLRILPPYLLMLSVVGGFAMAKHSSVASSQDIIVALLFISNLITAHGLLSITWSLSVEEQFYAVIPALLKHVGRFLPHILLILYLASCLAPLDIISSPISFFRETTFGPIILGAALAWSLNNERGYFLLYRLIGTKISAISCATLLACIMAVPAADISGFHRILIQWSMTALVGSCVVNETNSLASVLRFPLIKRIGTVSYGIYLYHMLASHISAVFLGLTGVLHFALTLAISWLIAEISFRYLELPVTYVYRPLSARNAGAS